MRIAFACTFIVFVGCQATDDPLPVEADAAASVSVDADATALDLDRGQYLDDLTPDELAELCEWMVAVQGGPHTVDCGDGVMVTIDPVDDCLAQPQWPHCEVGLIADCIETQAADLCADASPECDAFYACAFGI
jgi:hypothetical protein